MTPRELVDKEKDIIQYPCKYCQLRLRAELDVCEFVCLGLEGTLMSSTTRKIEAVQLMCVKKIGYLYLKRHLRVYLEKDKSEVQEYEYLSTYESLRPL